MKLIPLSQGKFAKVDDEDFYLLHEYKWSAHEMFGIFYAIRHTKGGRKFRKQVRMHREILNVTDPKIFIDHIDHDGLNNQRNNLRIVTHSQNKMNVRSKVNSTSQYLGVSWNSKSKKWVVKIQNIHLGYFDNEIEAAKAYDAAATKHHGEYANLNFK